MSVKMEIVYNGELKCTATHGPSGKQLTTEAPVDNGGKGEYFSPTDLVAVAFGSCVMTIMGAIAGREKINLEGTTLKVEKEMVSQPARRIGKLITEVNFPKGLNLSEVQKTKIERAVGSCPVKQSLHSDVIVECKFIY